MPPTGRPRVHVLATGGTIAGAQADAGKHGYTAGSLGVGAQIAAVPQLDDIATVTGEQLVNIGSQDMNDAVWLKLAGRLRELAASPEVDGIVVTHGTDTMEETAYFADLTTPGDKPVVFVGSMRPATAISADGPMNLYNAVAVAGAPAARGRGALVVLDDEIHAARNVYKTHTTRVGTFASPDRGPIGSVDTGDVEMFAPPGPRPAPIDVRGRDGLPRVEIVYAHSSMGRELIDAAVAAGAKGIVVAGVGNGNMTNVAMRALAEAVGKGVIVVRSTRLMAGEVIRNAEVDDDGLGFVVAGELKPSKARVLLQLLLLRSSDATAIQQAFDRY